MEEIGHDVAEGIVPEFAWRDRRTKTKLQSE